MRLSSTRNAASRPGGRERRSERAAAKRTSTPPRSPARRLRSSSTRQRAAIAGERIAGDLEIIPIADENAADRIGGVRPIVVDMIVGEHERVDDAERETPPRPMSCASASIASVKGLRRLPWMRLPRMTRSRTGSLARSRGVAASPAMARSIWASNAPLGSLAGMTGFLLASLAPARVAKPMPESPIAEISFPSMAISCRNPRSPRATEAFVVSVIASIGRADRRRLGDARHLIGRRSGDAAPTGRGLHSDHAARVAAVGGGVVAFEPYVDIRDRTPNSSCASATT